MYIKLLRGVKVMAVVALSILASACGTLGPKVESTIADQIDLGDGLVFGIVPISAAAAGADKVAPGSGAAVNLLGEHFAKQRQAKYGPFNGLPYTTERQVILTSGKVIPQSEIDRIVEILTPITPKQIVRVVEPEKMSFQVSPSVTNIVPLITNIVTGTSGGISPEDAAALEALNNLKRSND